MRPNYKIVNKIGCLGAVLMFSLFNCKIVTDERQPGGAQIYNLNCVRCHNARPAGQYSDREWDVIIPHMRERAHLTGGESNAVLTFLQISNQPETLEAIQRKNGSTAAEKLDQGESLVKRYQCTGCHQINGKGGKLGPELNGVIKRKGKSFVIKKIKNPRFDNPASAMPQFPISRKQVKAIVEYMESLK